MRIQLTLKNCQEKENEVISGQNTNVRADTLGAITIGCMRPFVPRTNKNEITAFVLMHDLSVSAQSYACTHIFQTTLPIHAGHEPCTCKRDA